MSVDTFVRFFLLDFHPRHPHAWLHENRSTAMLTFIFTQIVSGRTILHTEVMYNSLQYSCQIHALMHNLFLYKKQHEYVYCVKLLEYI